MKHLLAVAAFLLLTLSASAETLIAHPWAGKRVAYFGDSITDPRPSTSAKKYYDYLKEWLGITPYVYAVSGRRWDDIPRQADLLSKEHGDDFDAILIFMGTNDFNRGVPLGQWYTETNERVDVAHGGETKHQQPRKRRTLAMDETTFRGRINISLAKIKAMYPTKQVVLLTPIHRAGFFMSDKNWQPTEDYANAYGDYISDYADAVAEAGRVWSVPVIDLNALCGLYPMEQNFGRYFMNPEIDRLHPNEQGHERMARTLMYQLLALPCTF